MISAFGVEHTGVTFSKKKDDNERAKHAGGWPGLWARWEQLLVACYRVRHGGRLERQGKDPMHFTATGHGDKPMSPGAKARILGGNSTAHSGSRRRQVDWLRVRWRWPVATSSSRRGSGSCPSATGATLVIVLLALDWQQVPLEQVQQGWLAARSSLNRSVVRPTSLGRMREVLTTCCPATSSVPSSSIRPRSSGTSGTVRPA